MTPATAPHNPAVVDKLLKHHSELLGDHEHFIAALRGGAVDRVQPGTVFNLFGSVGRAMERSLHEDEIVRRAKQVELFMQRKGLEEVKFAPTKVGYTLALTPSRVLVFDFGTRDFLSQSPITNMRLEQVHVGTRFTLLFCEGRHAAAITSWEEPEITGAFCAIYNQCREAPTRRAS